MEAVIQMYGSGTSSADDAASIDIPEDGELMGVIMSIRAPGMAANRYVATELSFLSSSQFSTNDARGVIAYVELASGALNTNGLTGANNSQSFIFHKGLNVNAGERIHLHLSTNDTVNVRVRCHLIFKFKGGVRAVRRR